jgi:DNA-binding transcriptional ArsR family regulator
MARRAPGKRITVEEVIEYLNKRVGEPLYVRDIAEALGVDEKTVRRHLRTIRERYPDNVVYYRQNRRLVYEIKTPIRLTAEVEEEEEEEVPTETPGEEAVEEETVEAEEKSTISDILEEQ